MNQTLKRQRPWNPRVVVVVVVTQALDFRVDIGHNYIIEWGHGQGKF